MGSWNCLPVAVRARAEASAKGKRPNAKNSLSLIYRQRTIIQLQDRQISRRRKDLADVAAVPTTIRTLGADKVIEHHLAILAPGEALALPGLREESRVAVIAEHVQVLSVIILRVLIVVATR